MKKQANKDEVSIIFFSETTGEEVASVKFTREEFTQIQAKVKELNISIEEYFEDVMRVYLEMYG